MPPVTQVGDWAYRYYPEAFVVRAGLPLPLLRFAGTAAVLSFFRVRGTSLFFVLVYTSYRQLHHQGA